MNWDVALPKFHSFHRLSLPRTIECNYKNFNRSQKNEKKLCQKKRLLTIRSRYAIGGFNMCKASKPYTISPTIEMTSASLTHLFPSCFILPA